MAWPKVAAPQILLDNGYPKIGYPRPRACSEGARPLLSRDNRHLASEGGIVCEPCACSVRSPLS